MRKTLAILLTAGALSCWSWAQASNSAEEKSEKKAQQAAQQDRDRDNDAANPNGNITITGGPNVAPSNTSATIHWTTSGRAATIVKYGTDANKLDEKSAQPGGERDHNVTLSNLSPGTKYFFAIMTDDNTVRTKGEFQTTGTAGASAAAAPAAGANAKDNITITSGPSVTPTDNSATINWSTSGTAATIVHYGTDPNNLKEKSHQPGGARDHSVTLSNLSPNTTYYFAILTDDLAVRTKSQFQTKASSTAAAAAPAAPATGNLAIVGGPRLEFLSDRMAIVDWNTIVRSSSIVHFGTDKNNLGQTAEASWGATAHRVVLSGLNPNTTHFFQVESSQAQGTGSGTKSGKAQFTTLAPGAQAKSNPPIIPVQ